MCGRWWKIFCSLGATVSELSDKIAGLLHEHPTATRSVIHVCTRTVWTEECWLQAWTADRRLVHFRLWCGHVSLCPVSSPSRRKDTQSYAKTPPSLRDPVLPRQILIFFFLSMNIISNLHHLQSRTNGDVMNNTQPHKCTYKMIVFIKMELWM